MRAGKDKTQTLSAILIILLLLHHILNLLRSKDTTIYLCLLLIRLKQ